jgi:hypothetical protein
MKKFLLVLLLMLVTGLVHSDPPDLPPLDPDSFQRPLGELKPPPAATKYRFPIWVFDDPKGGNALVTTTQLQNQDKPLWTSTNYFRRFSPGVCKYDGKTTVMQVARTQKEFDIIMQTMVGLPAVLPRKLNFEKELFIFVFNGTQDANEFTLVEVSEVGRNGGPINLGKAFKRRDGKLITRHDSVLVRVEVQIGKPGLVQKGQSPWTMIRVNKETFFKEHPMSDDTEFVIIEGRNHIYTRNEKPVGK